VAGCRHAPRTGLLRLGCEDGTVLLNSGLQVIHSRAIQTRLKTRRGNTVVVTYKRQPLFASKRIELNVQGTRHYFGPSDNVALRSLLNSI
jgi:hypothetical protein